MQKKDTVSQHVDAPRRTVWARSSVRKKLFYYYIMWITGFATVIDGCLGTAFGGYIGLVVGAATIDGLSEGALPPNTAAAGVGLLFGLIVVVLGGMIGAAVGCAAGTVAGASVGFSVSRFL